MNRVHTMALFLLGLWPVLAQSVRLEPTSWETQGAGWEQILSGRGSWTFTADLVYQTPGSGAFRILLELVTAGPAGANLSASVTPGTPQRLSGTGALGTLAVSGPTLWPSGFHPLIQGIDPGVGGRLPLELTLSASAPGPLPPGYYFLQATVLLMPQ